jgi:altronate dehydratase small subunit
LKNQFTLSIDALAFNERDNVATTLKPLRSGETARTKTATGEIQIQLRDDVPALHKVAIKDINYGGHIVKFGEIIGIATKGIRCGTHVHTHNVASLQGRFNQKG